MDVDDVVVVESQAADLADESVDLGVFETGFSGRKFEKWLKLSKKKLIDFAKNSKF